MKATRFPPARRAFTLVEVLAVLAGLGIITTVGVVAVSNSRTAADSNKLSSDVASINQSVLLFQSSGGSLAGLSGTDDGHGSHSDVLTKLKTKGNSSTLGVTSSTLDARVYAVYQTSAEAATSSPRAVWSASAGRFQVATSGAAGVKKFLLNEDLASSAPTTDTTRTSVKTASTGNGWVWDQTPPVEVASTVGSTPGTTTANASIAAYISQGFTNGVEIVDGPVGADGLVTVSTSNDLFHGGSYHTPVGMFSMEGMGNPPYDVKTPAGLLAFMQEAVRRVNAGAAGGLGGQIMSADGTGSNVKFPPGTAVAFIEIPNDSFANSATYLAGASPVKTSTTYPITSLSFDAGAAGFYQGQAIKLGDVTPPTGAASKGVFAMEDMSVNQDFDYEDNVWTTTNLKQPDWSTITTVDPSTYYKNYVDPTSHVASNKLNELSFNALKDGTTPTLSAALTKVGLTITP